MTFPKALHCVCNDADCVRIRFQRHVRIDARAGPFACAGHPEITVSPTRRGILNDDTHSAKTCVVGCVDLLLCRVAAPLFKQRVRRFLKRGGLFRVLRKHFVHGLVRRLVRGVLLMLLHVLFAVLRVLRLIDNCAALLLVRRRNVQRITAALRK